MRLLSGGLQAVGLACSALLLFPSSPLHADQGGNKKPSLSLKATPAVSFAPARIVLVAELKGGDDSSDELYCPTVEWEWGDGTISTAEADCEPYEAGKSEVKRRFSTEHKFQNAGSYRVVLRLKKSSKIIATANANLQVRPGLTGY
jgi:hypothetical protein